MKSRPIASVCARDACATPRRFILSLQLVGTCCLLSMLRISSLDAAQQYYEVFRSEDANFANSERLDTWLETRQFVDDAANPEKAYTYWVRGFEAETVENSIINLTYSLDVTLTAPTAADAMTMTPVKAKVDVGGGIFGSQTGPLSNEIHTNGLQASWGVSNVRVSTTGHYRREWLIDLPIGEFEPDGPNQIYYRSSYLNDTWVPTPEIAITVGGFDASAPGDFSIDSLPTGNALSWGAAPGNTLFASSTSVGHTPVSVSATNESAGPSLLFRPISATPETPERLIVFDDQGGWSPGGALDSSKPTIVLSHGFASSYRNWPVDIADALVLNNINANIVAWDWEDDAAPSVLGSDALLAGLPTSGWQATDHGALLGERLLSELGLDYDQSVHFIGHSLGTRVNKVAADRIHSTWDPDNTHVTIFDAAEFAVVGEDLIPWSNPIPDAAVKYVDNYVTAVGELHPEAVNVQLFTEMPDLSGADFSFPLEYILQFHSLPEYWYEDSINNPSASAVGFRWSFEANGFVGAPAAGSYFSQDDTDSDNHWGSLNVVSQTEADARVLQEARNGRVRDFVRELAAATGKTISSTSSSAWAELLHEVRAVGEVSAEIVEEFLDGIPIQSLALSLVSASPAYAWTTVDIPADALFVTFDLQLDHLDSDDFFAFGIDETLLLSLDDQDLENGVSANVGFIDVSPWAGTTVDFFYGLETEETGRQAAIDNFNFLVTAPVSADFDSDGDVDQDDLELWKLSFGADELADADGDGDSDGADFLAWQRQFATSAGASESTGVPEPPSMVLCCGLVLLGSRFTRLRLQSRLQS